jgi:hypothetical protein
MRMTVGDFIAFFAPASFDYHLRHLNKIWFEPACFNQETLCRQLQITMDDLHKAFSLFDENNRAA